MVGYRVWALIKNCLGNYLNDRTWSEPARCQFHRWRDGARGTITLSISNGTLMNTKNIALSMVHLR